MSTMAMSTRIGRTGVSKRVLGRTAMRQLRGTSARSLQLQLHARMPSARGRIAVTQSRRARSPSPTTTGHAAEQLKASSLRVNAHTPKVVHTDFLVIGSGIAGLSYALSVADTGKVAIVTKDRAQEGSTRYAQGGICAVLDPLDSVESHAHDTMVAGDFLCDQAVVDLVCREGANAVLDLVAMGASFDRSSESGRLHLTREGGHAHKRVVHAADLTGAEIERTLLAKVLAHPNIAVYESHFATDLVTEAVGHATWCLGCDSFERATGREVRFLALATMIASGGAGHVYPSTTNPAVATGDGIAMAARAGASIGNMEFMQFHPTSFYAAAAPRAPPQVDTQGSFVGGSRTPVFLVSEAVRGEGGVLLDGSGRRFMDQYDPRGELAPRDVVARAIAAQCMKRGEPCAFLDISHVEPASVLSHFPNIAAHCAAHGLDMTREPIPVTPAMHYTCGGVRTGVDAATGVKGLFVCGEAAYTGLHGANRLASNSLLEGLVFGRGAAFAATAHATLAASSPRVEALHRAASSTSGRHLYVAKPGAAHHAREEVVAAALVQLRRDVQDTMWQHAGIVRTTASLRCALLCIHELGALAAALPVKGGSAALATAWYEVANLLTVAELVVVSALARKESRGLHYTLDFPHKLESERRPTLIHHPLQAARALDAVHAKRINRSRLTASNKIPLSQRMMDEARLTAKPTATLPIVEKRQAVADKGLVPK